MATRVLAMVCALAIGASLPAAPPRPAALVARTDHDAAAAWTPRPILGRDFWHLLMVNSQSQPDKGLISQFRVNFGDRRLFRESGFAYMEFIAPESGTVSMSTIDPKGLMAFVDTRPQAPLFFVPGGFRPVYRLMGKWNWDRAGYEAWKAAHPNFMGWVYGEMDNDFLNALPRFREKCQDPELLATLEREFPPATDRAQLTAQYLRACRAFREFVFDDAGHASHMRASRCLDHLAYEAGLRGTGVLETTNTGSENGHLNYRHQVALFFARGAARQYRREWMWYVATDLNGYNDQGVFQFSSPEYGIDTVAPYAHNGVHGPGCGMSTSLFTRDMFLAYLSGASFAAPEAWVSFIQRKGKDRFGDLDTPLGRAWEDWFEFTRNNPDRGASYTPVALLVPSDLGYPTSGGKSWGKFNYTRPDWMVDAFMYTIMPHSPVTRAGDEGALANSPYGDIYDVIVPNPPAEPVALDVLKSYKVAALLGAYPQDERLAGRLMEYVAGGGTLLLNLAQANGCFPEAFLGVKRSGGSIEVQGPIRPLPGGAPFEVPEAYTAEAVTLAKGATPLLVDAQGTVVASANRHGRGRVIVTTVDCLVPTNAMEYQKFDVLDQYVYGRQFPFIEHLLGRIVDEVLPVAVKGDIQYGLNKLSDGWLVYLINNRGVTKFTNRPERLDPAQIARVKIDLKALRANSITELREQKKVVRDGRDNAFTVDVPPGDIRVISIRVARNATPR